MNIVCIGAHPDDGEVFAGGTCAKWARLGNRVLLASMTNGDIGHHAQSGGTLAQRRTAEARLSANRAGCHSLVIDNHDGELQPTLDTRKQVVRLLREWQADIVLTHRPNDYHPDHRYTSVIVQDAAFLVTVPNFCPDVPRLTKSPAFFYLMDSFKKPMPFSADVAVEVTDVMDTKWDMLDAMESQMYEWLPWLDGKLDAVPADRAERREWLVQTWDGFFRQAAELARPAIGRFYGPEIARTSKYAEAFEICEYGQELSRSPSEEELKRIFPLC